MTRARVRQRPLGSYSTPTSVSRREVDGARPKGWSTEKPGNWTSHTPVGVIECSPGTAVEGNERAVEQAQSPRARLWQTRLLGPR